MDSRAPRPNDPRWPAIHVRAERNEYRPLEVQLLVWSPAYRSRFAAPMSFCSQYPTCGQIQAISTNKLSEEGMYALPPKADMERHGHDVRYVPIGDIARKVYGSSSLPTTVPLSSISCARVASLRGK